MVLLLRIIIRMRETRTWTRKNGETFKAEFVSWEPGKGVHLKGADGKEITVFIGKLSEEDRKYVRQHAKPGESDTGKPNVVKPSRSYLPGTTMRRWTRNNGETFEAEFIKREGKVVTFRKPDGTEMTVNMPKLIEEDRKYVNSMEAVRILTKAKRKQPSSPKQSPNSLLQTRLFQKRLTSRPLIPRNSAHGSRLICSPTCRTPEPLTTPPPHGYRPLVANLTDDQIALLCQYYLAYEKQG